MFHMTGKQAFSFYNRKNNSSVRLLLKRSSGEMTKDELAEYHRKAKPQELFSVMETKITVPEPARIFASFPCERCGETAGANWIRIQGDQKICLDCYMEYNRFSI